MSEQAWICQFCGLRYAGAEGTCPDCGRARVCIEAMTGIPDPAAFVKAVRELVNAGEAVKSAYATHQVYDKSPLPLVEAALDAVKATL